MRQTKYIFFLSLLGLIVTLDQFSKFAILVNLDLGKSQIWIPGLLSFTRVHNPGASFGIFATMPAKFREPFFLVFPMLILVLIVYLYYRLSQDQKISAVSLALIFGGAVGNLLDRIRLGFVVDFIDFFYGQRHYPAFNIADCAITLGVALWVLGIFFEKSNFAPKH